MIKEGNMVAFSTLIDRHRLFITRVVMRFLLRDDDAHEVVQDTFIRVWKHLDEFDGRGRFSTWIYTIAFNLCLDRMRVIRRRPETFPGDFGKIGEYPDEFNDPADATDNDAIGTAVRAYAAELGRVQRLVFILRDLQDLPVADVCRITGFDTEKVKSNLYHARKFMREKLLKGGYL
jgi:RNA polymerase sigma-70 factor (ECF subfamily)